MRRRCARKASARRRFWQRCALPERCAPSDRRLSHITVLCDVCTCSMCGRSVPLECIRSKASKCHNRPKKHGNRYLCPFSAKRDITGTGDLPHLATCAGPKDGRSIGFGRQGADRVVGSLKSRGYHEKYRGSSCLHHMVWTS